MNTMKLKQLYWKIFPYQSRAYLEQLRFNFHKNKVLNELDSLIQKETDDSYIELKNRIKANGLSIYNYSYVDNYPLSLYLKKVHYDNIYHMFYALRNSKKLYISRKYNTLDTAALCYRNICLEQDSLSPHRYLSPSFPCTDGGILLDIGAAEGFFALDNLDSFEKIYLLECDNDWLDALNKTFMNELEKKVIIIPKFASDINDKHNITIDKLLRNETLDKLTVKMDVEGFETKVLNGALKSFKRAKDIAAFITCYHRPNDDVKLLQYLDGFSYEYSSGYMINLYEKCKSPISPRCNKST